MVGPTRGRRHIDRIFVNVSRSITEYGTLAPLETEQDELSQSTASDHQVAHVALSLPRKEAFKWEHYSYRHYSEEGEDLFKAWIVFHEWQEVSTAVRSEAKADAYQETLERAVDSCFPLKTTKRKSTDLPWMSQAIRDQIRKRRGLYMEEGGVRTADWKKAKKSTNELIVKRKRGFLDKQKEHLLADDANRNFYKHVKNFSKLERPK